MPLPGSYQLTVPKFRPRDTLDHDANIRAVERAINQVPIFDYTGGVAALGTQNTSSTSYVDMVDGAAAPIVYNFTVYGTGTRVIMTGHISGFCGGGGAVGQYLGFRFRKTGIDITYDVAFHFHNAFGAAARHDGFSGTRLSAVGEFPPGIYTVNARWKAAAAVQINADGNDWLSAFIEERPVYP